MSKNKHLIFISLSLRKVLDSSCRCLDLSRSTKLYSFPILIFKKNNREAQTNLIIITYEESNGYDCTFHNHIYESDEVTSLNLALLFFLTSNIKKWI